jgi:hypothetical protein
MPTKANPPIKPNIRAFQLQESTCFAKADAALLFQYIVELEMGYE